MAKLIRIFKVC